MAECRVESLSDNNKSKDENNVDIPEGKVQKVCKEWLVREDGVLAYRLQNEEINQHYEGNRCKNRTVREDLPLAKNLQRSEEDEATIMRLNYERILDQQIEIDERVAREMQDKLLEQEYGQRIVEEEDAKLAQKLAQKERKRIIKKRLEKEKQQVEKLSAQLNTTNNRFENCDNEEVVGLANSVDTIHLSDENNTSPMSDEELDLSEFCLQPPPGLSAEEMKIFLEEQDAEIARLLQQQEMKRKSTVNKEKLAIIEAQDYEIARLLQKQEKERIRRLKERAKQKALQKQLENESNGLTIANRNNELFDERRDNHIYAEHQTRTTHASNYYSDADSITYEEPYQLYHHNIAMDLDPTYKRNSTATSNPLLNSSPNTRSLHSTTNEIESNVDDSSVNAVGAGIHFAQVYKVTPSSSESNSPVSTTQRTRDPMIGEDYTSMLESNNSLQSPVQPYLPVQGQRRISSMEKKKSP